VSGIHVGARKQAKVVWTVDTLSSTSNCKTHLRSAQVMVHIVKRSHSFTCTPLAFICEMEWTIPAFAFPAKADPHLLTPEGWKAVTVLAGYISRWFTRPGIYRA